MTPHMPCRQGKKKAFTLLQKNPDLQHRVVKVFNNPLPSPDSVSSVGEQFLLALYGACIPTSAAAKEHSFRLYHQVQQRLE
jgi:hypothetical protein